MSIMIEQALNFAFNAHRTQFRKDGFTPYIVHPIEVMRFLQKLAKNDSLVRETGNEEILAAALLHDTLEDCENTSEAILTIVFGKRIADLVVSLTFKQTTDNQFWTKNDYIKSFKHKSDEALLIKLADRICNVRDFASDPSSEGYALKYLKKADCLFEFLGERTNIRADVKLAILEEYNNLREGVFKKRTI